MVLMIVNSSPVRKKPATGQAPQLQPKVPGPVCRVAGGTVAPCRRNIANDTTAEWIRLLNAVNERTISFLYFICCMRCPTWRTLGLEIMKRFLTLAALAAVVTACGGGG
ncbi:MAG: hypothetical protein V4857_05305, partial [Pseudomonadota bacterium]